MAKIAVGIRVPGIAELQAGVLDHFASLLNKALNARIGLIQSAASVVVRKAILSSPQVESLLSGRLRHELGVVDAQPTVQAVAEAVGDGLTATSLGAVRQGDRIVGGVRLEILRSDLSEVIHAPGGTFQSEGGFAIPWLEWLTTAGDKILVADHRFEEGYPHRSRTGNGLMIHGGFWRIPPELSGVPGDNWVSRALELAVPELRRVIGTEISRGL